MIIKTDTGWAGLLNGRQVIESNSREVVQAHLDWLRQRGLWFWAFDTYAELGTP